MKISMFKYYTHHLSPGIELIEKYIVKLLQWANYEHKILKIHSVKANYDMYAFLSEHSTQIGSNYFTIRHWGNAKFCMNNLIW